jgi:hypothetical protein
MPWDYQIDVVQEECVALACEEEAMSRGALRSDSGTLHRCKRCKRCNAAQLPAQRAGTARQGGEGLGRFGCAGRPSCAYYGALLTQRRPTQTRPLPLAPQ